MTEMKHYPISKTTREEIDKELQEVHSKLIWLCDGMPKELERRKLEDLARETKVIHEYVMENYQEGR